MKKNTSSPEKPRLSVKQIEALEQSFSFTMVINGYSQPHLTPTKIKATRKAGVDATQLDYIDVSPSEAFEKRKQNPHWKAIDWALEKDKAGNTEALLSVIKITPHSKLGSHNGFQNLMDDLQLKAGQGDKQARTKLKKLNDALTFQGGGRPPTLDRSTKEGTQKTVNERSSATLSTENSLGAGQYQQSVSSETGFSPPHVPKPAQESPHRHCGTSH